MKLLGLLFVGGLILNAQAAVPLQPLALQVRQLEDALAYLGQPLARRRRAQDQRRHRQLRTKLPRSRLSNRSSTGKRWRSSKSTLKAG
jgi:hypothetical protein